MGRYVWLLLCSVFALCACGANGGVPKNADSVDGNARGENVRPAQPIPADCTDGAAVSKAKWEAFRKAHPLHIQGVIVSDEFAAGCRTLIVAEPPPHVTLEGLQSVDARLANARREQAPLGHDGFVRDAVAVLPKMAKGEVDELVDYLHVYLFGTAYKAHQLSWTPSPQTVDGLDVSVGGAELDAWVLGSNVRFVSVLGGQPKTAAEIAERGQSGVFVRTDPGVVVWAIPAKASLDILRVQTRQFALDSDLILGAVDKAGMVFVVGRERQVSTQAMPPLRAESIALLAAAPNGFLAQSYERQTLLAGRGADGKDRAPILLSPDIVDTEFGSLLNIADQYLKGWSQHGQIQYEGFVDAQTKFPFDKSLSEVLKAKETVFNWNTGGLATAFDAGDRAVVAFDRTGALPVDYIGDGKLATAQMKVGRDYFATARDPNLARVVSYTQLFTIFKSFGIQATRRIQATHDERNAVLAKETEALLVAVRDATPEKVRKVAAEIADEAAKGLPFVDGDAGRERAISAIAKVVDDVRADIKKEPSLQNLAQSLGVPNGGKRPPRPSWMGVLKLDLKLNPKVTVTIQGNQEIERMDFQSVGVSMAFDAVLLKFVDTNAAWKRIANAAKPAPNAWLHTPSIVVSSTARTATSQSSGGHNVEVRPNIVRLGSPKELATKGLATIASKPVPVRTVQTAANVVLLGKGAQRGLTENQANGTPSVADWNPNVGKPAETKGNVDLTVHIDDVNGHRVLSKDAILPNTKSRVAVADKLFLEAQKKSQKGPEADLPLVAKIEGATQADVDAILKTAALRGAEQRASVLFVIEPAGEGSTAATNVEGGSQAPLPNGSFRVSLTVKDGTRLSTNSKDAPSAQTKLLSLKEEAEANDIARLREKMKGLGLDVVLQPIKGTSISDKLLPAHKQYAGTPSHGG